MNENVTAMTLTERIPEFIDDFQYQRRFFCTSLPEDIERTEEPILIVQGYYVHDDNYALRVRVQTSQIRLPMTADIEPKQILTTYRDMFNTASVTIKGPSYGGTRYEANREIDSRIAAELLLRGGDLLVKNRYTIWQGEDGWNIDIFGGDNAPLIIAEAERSAPVTNLHIPRFCNTEITDQRRFSNDELSYRPFSTWSADFYDELATKGPQFEELFGKNTLE